MAGAAPTARDIDDARARLAGRVRVTPVETCRTLDALSEAHLFLKCEQLQRGGSFKLRGATNAVASLEPGRAVATHSSGNHGLALALAASADGRAATIVMPSDAPAPKRAAVRATGARIVDCGPTLASREATLAAVVAESPAEVVHPYDDLRVVAGQATVALELLEQVPDLDVIVAPVGGGGLLSGLCLGVEAAGCGARVVGAEPALADDAAESLRTGVRVPQRPPATVADGLRTALGEIAFEVLRARAVAIVVVTEAQIIAAMRLIWERAKLVVEPSAAVPVAAALTGAFRGRRVGVVLTGGNVDLDALPFGR